MRSVQRVGGGSCKNETWKTNGSFGAGLRLYFRFSHRQSSKPAWALYRYVCAVGATYLLLLLLARAHLPNRPPKRCTQELVSSPYPPGSCR